MSLFNDVKTELDAIEGLMHELDLWQEMSPSLAALSSVEPFCVDTLSGAEWLQWIMLPRMRAILEAKAPLPRGFNIAPYFEEELKMHSKPCDTLIKQLQRLDILLGEQAH